MRLLVVLAGLGLAGPALAQDGDRSSKAFDAVAACRSITDSVARLACFDRNVEAFATARSRGDVMVVDRTRVVERKRASFGLATVGNDVFGGGPEDRSTEVREVETTIRAVAAGRGDLWTLELANGQVWKAIETLRFPPRPGQPIKLTTAPLGGFRASVAGRTSILVKRVR